MGSSLGEYLATTLPYRSIRNLVKFHLIALVPKMPGASVFRYLYENGTGIIAINIRFVHNREGDLFAMAGKILRNFLIIARLLTTKLWLHGKPRISEALTFVLFVEILKRKAYCLVYPHSEGNGTLTIRTTLFAELSKAKGLILVVLWKVKA